LKDQTRNPTGSFKDRPISVAISRVLEFGNTVVITSTGNVASSIANMNAHMSMLMSKNKMAQALLFDAVVVLFPESTADDALKLSKEVAGRCGWYPWLQLQKLIPTRLKEIGRSLLRLLSRLGRVRLGGSPIGEDGNLRGSWKGFFEP